MPPLNVVHIAIGDDVGGAARSAYKIHAGVRALGLRSRMLVAFKFTDDPDVETWRPRPLRALDRPFHWVDQALSVHSLLVPSTLSLLAHPWLRVADVIQLYNLHGGYVSQAILPYLARRAAVVYRLSDMWAVTGHCAFSYGCERWRIGCGHCPHLDDYPSLPRDTTALNFRIKRLLYARSPIRVVAPSTWIERIASASPLLGRYPISRIPNGVDTGTFVPTPKDEARRILGLPNDRRIVLFSGTEARKGADLLRQALGLLADDTPRLFVTVGRDPSGLTGSLPAVHLGQIRDDARLALAYAAADVFVLPARADNLPNTVLEAFACGTPAVAFDVGGVGDAVRHLETGYLARPADIDDLASGIALLTSDDALRSRLQARVREVAEREYSLELQARRFADLYESAVRPK